jgi:hypothetical protein
MRIVNTEAPKPQQKSVNSLACGAPIGEYLLSFRD